LGAALMPRPLCFRFVGKPVRQKKMAGSKHPATSPAALSLEGGEPIVDVLPDLILAVSVAFLKFAFELIAMAINGFQIIVGKFAPLLLHFAGKLFPVSFDPIPIH
jgi:hypothetical protein